MLHVHEGGGSYVTRGSAQGPVLRPQKLLEVVPVFNAKKIKSYISFDSG